MSVEPRGENMSQSEPLAVNIKLQQFIEMNDLDERCVNALLSLDAVGQDYVMDLGYEIDRIQSDRGTASMIVMGRLKKLRNLSGHQRQSYPSPDMFMQRLKQFINLNNLDQIAQEALSMISPIEQYCVMEASFLIDGNSLSQSQIVLDRIDRVQKFMRGTGSMQGPRDQMPHEMLQMHQEIPQMRYKRERSRDRYVQEREVGVSQPTELRLRDFIRLNDLDAKCQDCLITLDEVQQNYVMDGGFMISEVCDTSRGSCSTIVMGRIKRARQMSDKEKMMYPPMKVFDRRVDDFIRLNQLDDRCVQKFRTLSPADQQLVMESGFMIEVDPRKGTANNVVMGRIKRVGQERQSRVDRHGPSGWDHHQMHGGSSPRSRYDNHYPPSRYEREYRRSRSPRRAHDRRSMDPPYRSHPEFSSHAIPEARSNQSPTQNKVQVFIAVNDLDNTAVSQLTRLEETQQNYVMDLGFVIDGVRADRGNPSSIVMGRVKRAKGMTESELAEYPTANAFSNRVKDFITVNNLDGQCSERLLAADTEVQQSVMDRGSFIIKVDPSRGTASSIVISRLKKY